MNGVKNFSLNKNNSTSLKILAGIVALFLFFAVLNLFSSQIKNLVYSVSSPIEKSFWSAGEALSGVASSVLNAGSLSKENYNLKSENEKLLSQIISLQAEKQAHQDQATATTTYENSGYNLVMASAMGLDGQDEITIDKGSADGIAEGMSVVNQYNVLFGIISKAYNNFSKVRLVSEKNSVINVKVQQNTEEEQDSEIFGVLKGDGGLAAHLDLVPVDSDLDVGNALVTSALEGTFPKGLLVGKITQINKNDQNPHQSAQVQLFLNAGSENLFVITNYNY